MKKNKKADARECEKGITLIALVVTIVILIILATISIYIVLKSGLIDKAQSGASVHELQKEKERLELIKGEVATDPSHPGIVTVDLYVEELIKKKITVTGEVTTNQDGSKTVITDTGYSVLIKPRGEKDVEIIIEGKVGKLAPRVENVQLITGKNNITINVTAKRAEGATYKYYYTEPGQVEVLAHEGTETSYEITGLKENIRYKIRVEVINDNGLGEATAEGRTGIVPDGNGAITLSGATWNKGKASIIVTKAIETDLEIQYKINNEEYKTIESGSKIENINNGDTIEVRMWNGLVGGAAKQVKVQETTMPNATFSKVTRGIGTGTTGVATIAQTDVGSGIDIENCKWEYTKEANAIGTEENKYTGTFTNATEEITIPVKEDGKYYLHILTVDHAGNKKESISGRIRVGPLVTGITTLDHDTIEAIDHNGNIVVMPGKFKVGADTGKTVQTGIVVEDEIGNQYVWIPVSNINHNGTEKIVKDDGSEVEITLGRYTFNEYTGAEIKGQYGSEYTQTVTLDSYFRELSTSRESTSSTTNTTAKNLGEFINSTRDNYGFYFARYEASVRSGNTYGVGNNSNYYKAASIRNVTPWKQIYQPQAAKVGRQTYYGDEYVESDLVNSYMWDTALVYIQYMGNTNYSNKIDGYGRLRSTGGSGDERCHIFDMASNIWEWTTEYCTYQGGYYPCGR